MLKGKLNKLKKDIKREIKIEKDIQWEKKLTKVKISSNAEDWKENKNILRPGKDKLTYSDLIGSDGKKAVTNKEKTKLFEENIKQIFCTEIPIDSNLTKIKKKLRKAMGI